MAETDHETQMAILHARDAHLKCVMKARRAVPSRLLSHAGRFAYSLCFRTNWQAVCL
jgi:hypothetical protein